MRQLALTAVILASVLLPMLGCRSPLINEWRCDIVKDQLGRDVEVCENRTCRSRGGRYVECPEPR